MYGSRSLTLRFPSLVALLVSISSLFLGMHGLQTHLKVSPLGEYWLLSLPCQETLSASLCHRAGIYSKTRKLHSKLLGVSLPSLSKRLCVLGLGKLRLLCALSQVMMPGQFIL